MMGCALVLTAYDLRNQITARINKLCYGLDMNYVDPVAITQKACATAITA